MFSIDGVFLELQSQIFNIRNVLIGSNDAKQIDLFLKDNPPVLKARDVGGHDLVGHQTILGLLNSTSEYTAYSDRSKPLRAGATGQDCEATEMTVADKILQHYQERFEKDSSRAFPPLQQIIYLRRLYLCLYNQAVMMRNIHGQAATARMSPQSFELLIRNFDDQCKHWSQAFANHGGDTGPFREIYRNLQGIQASINGESEKLLAVREADQRSWCANFWACFCCRSSDTAARRAINAGRVVDYGAVPQA